jgi:hypothetical protein
VLSLLIRHRKLYGLAGGLSKLPHLFCPSDEDIREIHNAPERQNRFHIVKYLWGQPGRGNKDNEVLGDGL